MSILERKPMLALRIGTGKAMRNGERIVLAAAPVEVDGRAYIPVSALPDGWEADGVCVIDGVEYTPGVKGVYMNYDPMGLIMLDPDGEVAELNHNAHRDYMMNIMAEMLFDIERVPIRASVYDPATEEQRAAYRRIGEDIVRRLGERRLTHPMIMTSGELAAKIRELYLSRDGRVIGSLDKLAAGCEKLSADNRFELNEAGDGLKNPVVLEKENPDGYDVGGRHSTAENRASEAARLAFGYVITENELYAKQAYYTLVGVCELEHWGPGHFLNCAQAACFAAMAYDWLYGAWKKLGLDPEVIREGIYRHGIYQGYLSAIFDRSDFPSAKQGTGWRFKAKPDNWNAVCNGGLIVAALAILAEGIGGAIGKEEFTITTELIGCSLATISHGSLVLKQYAPDGSYVESNSYWSYGTTSLMRALGAIYDALGTDLGLSLSGGLDKTCYYALSSESCDFVGWNYHDGSLSGQNTEVFNLFATVSGDHALYSLRELHVSRGKGVGYLDILYHPAVRGYEPPKLNALPLDCYMEGIDAFVVRSGWAAGSLYAGIMGGYNPKGGSHNQLDSGSFVYHNKGVLWLTDMGPDYYNITGGYFGNYKLYRRCAEGNNVLSLPSIDYGQCLDSTGHLCRHHSGENAFAVIDNREVYGGKVSRADRAMLLTNGRKTTVIQDEVDFTEPTDAYWVGHFKASEITANIAEGGSTCTLTHKDGASVKLSIVGDGCFEIRDCYDFLLPTTADFEGEYNRKDYARLVIGYKAVTSIRTAVVIESKEDNGYPEMLPISAWSAE